MLRVAQASDAAGEGSVADFGADTLATLKQPIIIGRCG